MREQWREIAGYEGLYEVSNLGNVRSMERTVAYGKASYVRPSKMMKVTVGKNLYCRVTLTKDAKQTQVYVHRLVAMAFIPNPDNLAEVDHIDANPSNNRCDNLRWVTHSENMRHMFELGRNYDGTANFFTEEAKKKREQNLKKLQKPLADDTGMVYNSLTEAARLIGVTSGALCNALKAHRPCRGRMFRYLDKTNGMVVDE